MPSSLRPPWREAGLLFSELQGHLSHQVWSEWRPQDTVLREGVSWGSLGSFTQAPHTHCEQLVSAGPSVWALGRWRPMAQLTHGHHGVHSHASGGLSVSAEVTRAFREPSGTLRCLGATGPPLPFPHPSSSFSLQQPVLFRGLQCPQAFQHGAFPLWNWDCWNTKKPQYPQPYLCEGAHEEYLSTVFATSDTFSIELTKYYVLLFF